MGGVTMGRDLELEALALTPGRPGPYDMELASGRYLNLRDPDPADIYLEDVAHHLSRICRYTGAIVAEHYSVAEHAVLVARRLERLGSPVAVQLCGLHHDDPEAFVGDVARPLKHQLRDYGRFEVRTTWAVEQALGMQDWPWTDGRIKEADTWALAVEAHQLMPSRGVGWISDGLYDREMDGWVWALGWNSNRARRAYMDVHEELSRLAR